jgi:hypothetical protein
MVKVGCDEASPLYTRRGPSGIWLISPARASRPTARTHRQLEYGNNSTANPQGSAGARRHRQRHSPTKRAHPKPAAGYSSNTEAIGGLRSASICSVSIDARRRRRRHGARPCHLPQASAHDGGRRDCDERAGQGFGVHGASALQHGYTLTPNTHKRFGQIF